jgi:hypothetical protein
VVNITDPDITVHPAAWSPDGTRIAINPVVTYTINHEIHVMNANGSGAVNITNNAALDVDPTWGVNPPPQPADADCDGIYDAVDTDDPTPSSNFSDAPNGTSTVGSIVSVPANTVVTIDDAAGAGIRVTTAAIGAVAADARVHLSLTSKHAQIFLAVPGTFVITDPVASTVVATEALGPAEVELTLNGSLIRVSVADGASATVNETTNASGALTEVTVSNVTGDSGDVTINGAPVQPGSPPVPVTSAATLGDTKLTVNRGKLTMTGIFTPAAGVTVDPGTSDVTFQAGAYFFVKTVGLGARTPSGAYKFDGVLSSAPGVTFSLELKQTRVGGPWTVKATASTVTGFVNPVAVSLRIGGVLGGQQVTATLR